MKFRQFDNEHVAQAWERMNMVKNCPTHGLTMWMVMTELMGENLLMYPQCVPLSLNYANHS